MNWFKTVAVVAVALAYSGPAFAQEKTEADSNDAAKKAKAAAAVALDSKLMVDALAPVTTKNVKMVTDQWAANSKWYTEKMTPADLKATQDAMAAGDDSLWSYFLNVATGIVDVEFADQSMVNWGFFHGAGQYTDAWIAANKARIDYQYADNEFYDAWDNLYDTSMHYLEAKAIMDRYPPARAVPVGDAGNENPPPPPPQ